MTKKATRTTQPESRVGIYCRQSVASDLEFGSIDAQREAVEAYVASQRGEGWVALPDRYDDHGFSGGNTERPAFRRLLADLEAGKVDIVAAYKIDRVSRSLTDFTGFMAALERLGVGFVSTTQSFDTRSSMGRLTLNILASFSQFERDVISERTKDKVAATRRKGLWTGGRPVLGYDVVDKGLVLNETEAEQVRTIFDLYLDHGGLVSTVAELERRGIRNKSWSTQGGKKVRGGQFNKSTLRALLTNPLYTGKIRCNGDVVDGRHEAIVTEEVFDRVARALRERRRTTRGPGKWNSILGGLLRCARCGAAMSLTTTKRGATTYRYYCCGTSMKRGTKACPRSRAPAGELEEVVIARVRAIGQDPSVLLATVRAAEQARMAREPELIAESRRITTERSTLDCQRRNLLDALQTGGPATNTIAGRLAEVDEQIGTLERRHAEVADELAQIATASVDEDALREALGRFTPIWDELLPRERARLLRLLIDEVRFDGQAGEIEISFRERGLDGLICEVSQRRTG